jgi:hypothetical protein
MPIEYVNNAASYLRSIDQTVKDEILAVATEIASRASANAPQASGALAGSFIASFGESQGDGFFVQVGSPLWGTSGAYVEFGTRPHWAPIAPIIDWVNTVFQVRAIGIEFGKGVWSERATPTARGTKRFSSDERTRIAYAVRYNIAQRGTKAQRYLARALDSMNIPYTVTTTASDIYYSVNIAPMLLDRDIWGKIIAQADAGAEK